MNHPISPLKAHRRICLQCRGGNYKEIAECEETGCESHPFRFGMTPARAARKYGETARIVLPEGYKDGRAANKGTRENLRPRSRKEPSKDTLTEGSSAGEVPPFPKP